MAMGANIDEAASRLFIRHLPAVFQQSITTIRYLEGMADASKTMDIAHIHQLTVTIVGNSFFMFNYDTSLVDSIDKDALLRITLFVLFDHKDYFPPSILSFAVESCGYALGPNSFQAYATKPTENRIIRGLMNRMSPDKIAAACGFMWSCPSRPTPARGLANLASLIHSGNKPVIHEAFVRQGVYKAIARAHWEMLKESETPEDDVTMQGLIRMTVISRLFYDLHLTRGPDPIVSVVTELLVDADLLLLLGKLLLGPKFILFDQDDQIRESTKRHLDWGGWIAKACEKDSELMEATCQPAWTHVMQRLLDLDRCTPLARDEKDPRISYRRFGFAIERWRELGQQIRVADRMDISSEPHWTPRSENRLPCSWVRCPLHQDDPASKIRWNMLRCTRCRKVQYCGGACQKRHWVFSHHAECSYLD